MLMQELNLRAAQLAALDRTRAAIEAGADPATVVAELLDRLRSPRGERRSQIMEALVTVDQLAERAGASRVRPTTDRIAWPDRIIEAAWHVGEDHHGSEGALLLEDAIMVMTLLPDEGLTFDEAVERMIRA